MTSSNRLIVGILVVTALAIAFWVLLLSPKRQEASELSTEIETQQTTLVSAQSAATAAVAAKQQFPKNYHQLVVLGQAVPENDETASLLVELNHIADHAHVKFQSIQLQSTSEAEAPVTEQPRVGATSAALPGSLPSATEASAALLPLGAAIGSAGLAVMPYHLTFEGDYFQVADFIHGVDSLLRTENEKVEVDGRLVTLDSFDLTDSGESEAGPSGKLTAEFSVTTYLVPPEQGLTAGASSLAPASEEVAETPTATQASSVAGEGTAAG
jgi:Tfp pilus assembly protein PilO